MSRATARKYEAPWNTRNSSHTERELSRVRTRKPDSGNGLVRELLRDGAAEHERVGSRREIAREPAFDDRYDDRRLEQEAGGQQLDAERHLLVAPDACVGLEADVAVLVVGQLLQCCVIEALLHERTARSAASEIEHGITIEAVTRRTLGIPCRSGRRRCSHAAESDRQDQQPVAASCNRLAAPL